MHDVHASGFRPISECAFGGMDCSVICAAIINEPALSNTDSALPASIGLRIVTCIGLTGPRSENASSENGALEERWSALVGATQKWPFIGGASDANPEHLGELTFEPRGTGVHVTHCRDCAIRAEPR
jgi:hypothetical protein